MKVETASRHLWSSHGADRVPKELETAIEVALGAAFRISSPRLTGKRGKR